MSSAPQDVGTEPVVLTEIVDGVGVITLNRPTRLNAWNTEMEDIVFDTLEAYAIDPDVRVILIKGAGRSFCAGADMSALTSLAGEKRDGPAEAVWEARNYLLAMTIGKPVVGAIQGHCVGVGMQQALCFDVRIAADDVKFGTAYAKRGLVGELAFTWNLNRITGVGVAMDMMLSARPIGAEEALRAGLVSQVFPADKLVEEAMNYCRTLAKTCSPWSMRILKQQVIDDLDSDLPSAYKRASGYLSQAIAGADMKEGVSAFVEKRPVAFAPLPKELARIKLPTA